ncbi:MAG: amino acid adenylation domain-containing protein, partial [Rhodanobacteraceae bacterium]
EKDYVATRVAHRLDLKGPALSIHTACSTSLVAVAQAWYALMSWQCDLALAGGINIVVPQESGYLPVEGAMESEDGHCRPFDTAASGTVFSSGGAVVALKRVADAIEAGDTIWAVIRSVAVNNDGGDKASFSAPSVRGQAAVIRQAMAMAGIEARSIGYVEAHGTGTPLGDPIEIEALTRAFREDRTQDQSCWIGSLKSNVGHMIAASGVAGLIKATLALHHGQIPPTLHFRAPNPEIDFAAGPFKVADRVIDWPRGDAPRRAGVSSFGVGGTNAHIVLEEAPIAAAPAAGRPCTVLLLSARDEPALQRRATELSVALQDRADNELADIGYTLALGRKPMPVRGVVVAGNIAEARARLAAMTSNTLDAKSPRLVFLFPGQGSQHANMARALVDSEPVFREAFERCCTLASARLGRDLRALILPALSEEQATNAALAETRYTQPALFTVEYALAKLWESWGIVADAMIGHSSGEYVAATLAGVFTLEDAIALVCARGAAMFAQSPGAMLAVRAGSEDLINRLPAAIEIAAHNAPALTIVSGAVAAIDAFATSLTEAGIASTRLHVSHAFHSSSMEGALPEFRRAFDGVRLESPQGTFYSCVSGLPAGANEATSVDYWCAQLRQPVRFAEALQHALAQGPTLTLEVGPGQALTALARTMLGSSGKAIASLGPVARPGDAAEQVQRALGECWRHGAEPDWASYYTGQSRRRIALPVYPFRGERYWIDAIVAPQMQSTADEEGMMGDEPTKSAPDVVAEPRTSRLSAELRELFENLSGAMIAPQQDGASFLELGLDSLALTQAALEIERRYGVRLKFRRLLEDLDSVGKLAALLDDTLPVEAIPAAAVAAPIAATNQPTTTTDPALAELIRSQMALMQQQTQLLAALTGGSAPASAPAESPSTPIAKTASIDTPIEIPEPTAPANLTERPFGASARIVTRRHGDITPKQRAWLDAFTQRYSARTAKSKAFSQQHRKLMADPRVVTGFNPLWKELVYPIVVERSQGACLWDLDGNEYIDVLNGFGSNFLGYQPEFIAQALRAQIHAGYEIGPQHPLTAEVAKLIGDMTGMQRVAFCNTGSEAVMGAMRIARTVTGRKTIVIFKDSYHGIFDEVIVRGTRALRSIAAAPGILANAVENVLVLDYGSDEALRIIGERAHELAAVMIEPVQSRNPTLQPRGFVQRLRPLCDAGGCALIFDEVITGFRVAQGGAQEFYGVRADLATYGKIIGGGLPFAAIAGSAKWMDALDGGDWRFGDDSYPEAGVTYFAGTFVRHPLALAAAKASLEHLKQRGPALQRELNQRTAALVERLNHFFGKRAAPLNAIGASSLWRVSVDTDQPCASLFYYALRERGLHVYEQFNGFLSEAHGDAEADAIATRIESVVDELLGAGVLTPRVAETNGTDATIARQSGKSGSTASGSGAVATLAAQPQAELPADVPLTDAQLEKWVTCQFGGKSNLAFNESLLLTLDGALDRAALERALAFITRRHEAFALSFAKDGSAQHIGAAQSLAAEFVDLSGVDAEARLDAHCAAMVRQPFDLTRAPLLRAQLLRLAPERHALLVVAHHLVFDGWSEAVFLDELAQAYNAFVAGHQPELAPAESYRAYVLTERARRAGGDASLQKNYWKRIYPAIPEALLLPADRQFNEAVPVPDLSAATVRHEFSEDMIAGLRQRARREGVTLYSLLLAGFGVWLARLSGQHDFAIGIPFAGQALAGSDHLIGDGVNTLPLRLSVPGQMPFGELARATHRALLDASEHQDITLQTLLHELGVTRGSGRRLAEVIFNLNPRVPRLAFTGLDYSLRDCAKAALSRELFFNLNDSGKTLTLDLHYLTALFDEPTIRRWIGHYETLLGAAAADDGIALAALPLLTDAQRDVVLHDWNATAREYDRGASVPALIASQAARTPDRIAVECEDRSLSYAELERHADAVASTLISRGVGRGDLVGVCLPRSVEMLVAVLGIMKSGAAYVPLDPEFPAERLRYMAEHAGIRQVLVSSEGQTPDAIAQGRELLELTGLDPASVPASPLPTVGGEDIAYVLYTSGSTGQPKGVRVAHRNLVNFLTSMRERPGIEADDVLCAVTTLSFDIAGLELYLPLTVGARIVLATEHHHADPDALFRLLHERDVTLLQTTPSLLRQLLDGDRIESVRGLKLLVGGEKLPRDLAERVLPHCRELWNLYGPTETTIWSTVQRVHSGEGPVLLGTPIANTRIYVLDEPRQPQPPGVVGEIWIGGDGVADGYLHQPELTAERLTPDPFVDDGSRMYRTGDLGSLHDGVLHFHGRADHQIKLRGYRIEPGDIESAAMKEAGVREALVMTRDFGAG